jgi:hypothetical protein
MKRLVFAFATLALLGLTSLAVAQPSIGVYFDVDGNTNVSTIAPGTVGTGYVLVKDVNALLGGASFGVDFAGDFLVLSATYADGVILGDLVNGVEIGLYNSIPNFSGDAAVMATFDYISFTTVNNSQACVVAHPNYSSPVVADSNGILSAADGLCATFNIRAIPEIGLFWDTEGTQLHKVANGGFDEFFDGYILVRGAEALVSGATFKLTNDTPALQVLNTVYAPGVVLGSLFAGVEIGLYSNVPVFGADTALLATLNMWAGNSLIEATLNVVNHPNYGAPVIADSNAIIWNAVGLESTLSIPVANENATWGQVKSLY